MTSKINSKQTVQEEFAPSTYLKIGMDDLVTAALYFLQRSEKTPTFENLVAKAYELFPERFAMVGYPQWPDSALINKSWLRCRADKQLITGSVATGFTLTPKGEKVAEKTLLRLNFVEIKTATKKGDRRSIAGRVVSRVEKSMAYKKFLENNSIENVTEYEMCDLLYGTLESSPETLAKNYETVIQNLNDFPRNDLIEFLKALRNKFLNRFVVAKMRGGMLPQKT
ncbi:MAG TPA: hypothetical protein VNL73_03645 [Verrucomicrobiae bacterium]|nr:hypothetical protein [Verrucomicrobiae bacterium]